MPDVKFIVTKRDNATNWRKSLFRHTRELVSISSCEDIMPTVTKLKECGFLYKGFIWDYLELTFGVDEHTLQDKSRYVNVYHEHLHEAKRLIPSERLLILNVSDADAALQVNKFLGLKDLGQVSLDRENVRDPMYLDNI